MVQTWGAAEEKDGIQSGFLSWEHNNMDWHISLLCNAFLLMLFRIAKNTLLLLWYCLDL